MVLLYQLLLASGEAFIMSNKIYNDSYQFYLESQPDYLSLTFHNELFEGNLEFYEANIEATDMLYHLRSVETLPPNPSAM